MSRKRLLLWIAAVAGSLSLTVAGLWMFGQRQLRSLEPLIRKRAIEYLSTRFDAQVELAELHVHLGNRNVLAALFRRGQGMLAEVTAGGLVIRHHGQTDLPPLFRIRSVQASIGFESLLRPSRRVSALVIDGMEINIPPREEHASTQVSRGPETLAFGEAHIRNARLTILSKKPAPQPLEFQIRDLALEASEGGLVDYRADLTNPKPAGDILSEGTFGPWDKENPGATPVSGRYDFKNADLSVFPAIAGILQSTGTFAGALSSIKARGEATVPDFRLKRANNRVALKTSFEVLVDGTNGNTELLPVHAVLGSTAFTTSGAVLKRDGKSRRTIALRVNLKQGRVEDLLTLAMPGKPMLEGGIDMNAAILVPPIAGKVREKLIVDGTFAISKGLFLQSTFRQRLDALSRRAKGEPRNLEIEDVMTQLGGKLHIEDDHVSFPSLDFSVPGAKVALTGSYDMQEGELDFEGSAALDAKISQTLTGWKHIFAKPLDPLFARNGAGTYLPIEIRGTSDHPRFSVPIRRAIPTP